MGVTSIPYPGPPRWSSAGTGRPPRGPGHLLVVLFALAVIALTLTAVRRTVDRAETQYQREREATATPAPSPERTETGQWTRSSTP